MPKPPPKRSNSQKRIVMGRHAVSTVLSEASERIERLLVEERSGKNPWREGLVSEAEKRGLLCKRVAPFELDRLCGSDSHQGCAAELKDTPELSVKELLADLENSSQALIVALDGVTDPQNIGSILRAAECFGASAVLWSRSRGPEITPTVSKVSSGASELVPVLRVGNLGDALKRIKASNFWLVTADLDEGSESIEKFEFPKRTVLALGAEGAGISSRINELADFRVGIPVYGQLDSLNVSQASAVFFWSWRASCGR